MQEKHNLASPDAADIGRKRRDMALLVFTAIYIPAASGLFYVSTHFPSADFIVWFPLFLFSLLFVAAVAILILIRCVTLRIHRSPLLLIAAGMLIALPWYLNYAELAIDWFRFQYNRAHYEAQAAAGVTTFNWGETGFLSTSSSYRLVFDPTGKIMSSDGRLIDLTGSRCSVSVSRLNGHFYSEKTNCG